MATNYGVRAASHHQALVLAPQLFGPTLPPLCDPPAPGTTPRIVAGRRRSRRSQPTGRDASWRSRRCRHVHVAVQVAHHRAAVRTPTRSTTSISSRGDSGEPEDDAGVPYRLRPRCPNVWTSVVQQAAAPGSGQRFLAFSRFPAARSAIDAPASPRCAGPTCGFVGGVTGLDQPGAAGRLVHRDDQGRAGRRILEETLRRPLTRSVF